MAAADLLVLFAAAELEGDLRDARAMGAVTRREPATREAGEPQTISEALGQACLSSSSLMEARCSATHALYASSRCRPSSFWCSSSMLDRSMFSSRSFVACILLLSYNMVGGIIFFPRKKKLKTDINTFGSFFGAVSRISSDCFTASAASMKSSTFLCCTAESNTFLARPSNFAACENVLHISLGGC
jgi:hypothetical protein